MGNRGRRGHIVEDWGIYLVLLVLAAGTARADDDKCLCPCYSPSGAAEAGVSGAGAGASAGGEDDQNKSKACATYEAQNKAQKCSGKPGGNATVATGHGPDAYKRASGSYGEGIGDEMGRAHDYENAAGRQRSVNSSELSLSHAISSDMSTISGTVQPLMANPQTQSQAQSYLSQPATPPAGHEQEYQQLGLNTNRDILQKGPDYTQNLNDAAEYHDQQANSYNQQAQEATAAANQMQGMNQTLAQRESNIQAVSGQTMASSSGGNGTNGSALTSFGEGNATANTALLAGATSPDSPNAAQAGNQAAAGGRSANAAPAMGAGASRSSSSLADQLRAAYAKAHQGDATAGPVTRAFDSIFEAGPKKTDETTAGAVAEAGRAAPAEKAGRFSMSGSETDRAVKRLLASSQGADEEVFGNVDQTIFARMSKCLTKAQADRRISSR